MSELFIGIDLGGTNIKIGLFDADLNLLGKASVPTCGEKGPDHVVDLMVEAAGKLVADKGFSFDELVEVGVGSPGPVNLTDGIVVSAPNLPLFWGYPIRDRLSEKIGKPVILENDANAAGWAEHVLGAAKGVDDMVFLTLGTGIGGAVISSNQIVHGNCDAAGELGHIIIYPDGRECGCGQKGCSEAYASASSTAKRAQEALESGRESSMQAVLKENGKITCKDVYDHLESGDELAKEISEGSAKVLGLLCADILNFTSPEKIIFAGGMIAAGDALLSRIRHYYNMYAWPSRRDTVEICFATLGEDAGIIGNAALAIRDSRKS